MSYIQFSNQYYNKTSRIGQLISDGFTFSFSIETIYATANTMSAKKKDKAEWSLCDSCQCYFPRTAFTKHSRSCESQNSEQFGPIESGFIEGDSFHGLV